ncbi:MAG: hypothetical protein ISS36_03435 [Candidatus Aenigmarchaeota archaeon]|nr:hypothetical protein [Candidatus Aenigmarchaeota archaeon]
MAHRLLVKVGSGYFFSRIRNGYDFIEKQMDGFVYEISELMKDNEVLIVSSGAIAMQASLTGLSEIPEDDYAKARLSALGQPHLMRLYDERFFDCYGIDCAQCLITRDDLRKENRSRRRNIRRNQEAFFEDGVLEIVVGRSGGITVYNIIDSQTTSWEIDISGAKFFSIIIADLNEDGFPDIVTADSELGKVFAFDYNGNIINGFPKNMKPENLGHTSGVAVCDLENDGTIELVAGSQDSYVYIWDLNKNYDESTMDWPMFQHDLQHTGLYTKKEFLKEIVVEDFESPLNTAFEIYDNNPRGFLTIMFDEKAPSIWGGDNNYLKIWSINKEQPAQTGFRLTSLGGIPFPETYNTPKISWEMNAFSGKPFIIYVRIRTKEGLRYLTYKPLSTDYAEIHTNPTYLKFGIGVETKNGQWHTIERDMAADLKRLEPDNEYLSLHSFLVRGSMYLDNIELKGFVTESGGILQENKETNILGNFFALIWEPMGNFFSMFEEPMESDEELAEIEEMESG